MANNWGAILPIYVTRENADGIIASWNIAAWSGLLILVLLQLNLILWGAIGVYEAVTRI